MAGYLQRLINRTNANSTIGASDEQRRMTPFIRQRSVEGDGGIGGPFETAAPELVTQPQVVNELGAIVEAKRPESETQRSNDASPLSSKVESSVPSQSFQGSDQLHHGQSIKDGTTSLELTRHDESYLQTEFAADQRTKHDAIEAQTTKTNQRESRAPIPTLEPQALNSESSENQLSFRPSGEAVNAKQVPVQEPLTHSQARSNTPLAPEAGEQSETRRSQGNLPGVIYSNKNTSPPPIQPANVKARSQIGGTGELRPRSRKALSNTPHAKEQPRLVIGKLQVDVIPPQPEAPSPQAPVAPRAERQERNTNERLTTKLRFGLGQL